MTKPKNKKPDEFRVVDYADTSVFNIARHGEYIGAKESSVRLYCTSSGDDARWQIQVRAPVRASGRRIEDAKQFAIGSASLDRDAMRWLRSLIDAELREVP